MSETFAELLVKFSSSGGAKLDGELKSVESSAGRAGRATDGFMKSLAALGLVAGTISIGKEIINTTREFEKLEAGLITSTGSAENAAKAFDALKEFAAKTPYDLKQTTTAFTQLVNLGLDPGERAMKAYGNTAAAMNKDLSQMVEAVADASTGEYERLKEFGIKAKSEGDKVTFTFRGMSETVKNNSQSIQDYLIKLGETNFADAMANRMNTLDGAISNLGDSWDQLKNNIGKSGFGDAVEDQVRKATGWMDTLNEKFDSGEIEFKLEKISAAFATTTSGIQTDIEYLNRILGQSPNTEFFDNILKGVTYVQSGIAALTVQLAAQYDKMKAMSSGGSIEEVKKRYDIIDAAKKSQLDEIETRHDNSVKTIGKQVVFGTIPRQPGKATDRLSEFGVKSTSSSGSSSDTKATDKSKREFESLMDSLRTEEEAINDSYKKRNEIILKNTEEGSTLRADLEKRSREKYEEDKKKLLESASNDELGKLVDQLKTEEERIEDSYKKRLEIIRSSTKEESSLRKDLEARAKEQHDKELEALKSRQNSELEAIVDSLRTQDEKLKNKYDKDRETILNSTGKTESEKLDLLNKLEKAYIEQQESFEAQKNQVVIKGAEDVFGSLAGIAGTFGGKQTAMYKALFATSKAFAIADSIISIQQGLAKANSVGWPANIAAMASVAAATSSIVSNISAVTFSPSGAYDTGGIIPPGRYGLVGEVGPEFVKGPAFVTSRRSTADKLKNQAPTVNIHNYAGVEVETKTKQGISGQELEIIIKRVAQQTEAAIASGIARGEGAVTKTLETAYSIRRGRN